MSKLLKKKNIINNKYNKNYNAKTIKLNLKARFFTT